MAGVVLQQCCSLARLDRSVEVTLCLLALLDDAFDGMLAVNDSGERGYGCVRRQREDIVDILGNAGCRDVGLGQFRVHIHIYNRYITHGLHGVAVSATRRDVWCRRH